MRSRTNWWWLAAAAACLAVTGCGTDTTTTGAGQEGTPESTAPTTTGAPSTSEAVTTREAPADVQPSESPIQPLNGQASVAIPESRRELPVPNFGDFSEYTSSSFEGMAGERLNGISFRATGPVEGSAAGSLTVSVVTYPAAVENVAAAVDPQRGSVQREIGGVDVTFWNLGELDGSDIRQGTRSSSRYAWLMSPAEIAQVTIEGVDEASASAYVETLTREFAS